MFEGVIFHRLSAAFFLLLKFDGFSNRIIILLCATGHNAVLHNQMKFNIARGDTHRAVFYFVYGEFPGLRIALYDFEKIIMPDLNFGNLEILEIGEFSFRQTNLSVVHVLTMFCVFHHTI